MTGFENVGVFIWEKLLLEPKLFPYKYPNILNPSVHTYPPMKMEQSAPKRRFIKFRSRGIAQTKAYDIQNTEK